MRFESTSYVELFNQAAKKLANRTGISNYGASGKASAIINTFLDDDRRKVAAINDVFESIKLASATGDDLDAIGEFLGVFRLTATRAVTKSIDKNMEFYVESGTFGDINNGSNFTIPANTIVFLESKDADSGRKIEYRTTSSIVCTASASSVYFPAEAIEPGTLSNVAALALNKHSFTSYTLSSANRLKVRNNYGVANGRDKQSDASYRSLISKTFTALASANETALKLAAQAVPGVKECKVFRNYNGIGTSALIIDGYEGSVGPAILDGVRSRINQYVAAGEIASVIAPKYVGLELEFVVKTSTNLTSIDKTKLTNNLISLIKVYLNSFNIGQSVDLDNLYSLLVRSNNQIVQIGRVAGRNTAELVNAYHSDSFGQFSNRSVLNNLVPMQDDQKVILMDTLTNPIRITIEKI